MAVLHLGLLPAGSRYRRRRKFVDDLADLRFGIPRARIAGVGAAAVMGFTLLILTTVQTVVDVYVVVVCDPFGAPTAVIVRIVLAVIVSALITGDPAGTGGRITCMLIVDVGFHTVAVRAVAVMPLVIVLFPFLAVIEMLAGVQFAIRAPAIGTPGILAAGGI